MPSPSPMPRGEFVSGSPERGSPVRPSSEHQWTVLSHSLSYTGDKNKDTKETVPVLVLEKARQTLNN